MTHRYTTEQADFLKRNVKGRKVRELTEIFNDQFGLNLKDSQIRAFIKNHGLRSGVDARFNSGHVPFNKGKKGVTQGGKSTQFKEGQKPHNYMPVGSERVNGDGYVDVKVADPNKWRAKHLLIWEEENGPVPKGYAVIFGDGNRHNFDIENLILVSRKQLAILNKNKLIQDNTEMTKTGIIVADIYGKIGERKREKNSTK